MALAPATIGSTGEMSSCRDMRIRSGVFQYSTRDRHVATHKVPTSNDFRDFPVYLKISMQRDI